MTPFWRRLLVAVMLLVGAVSAIGDIAQGLTADDWIFLVAVVPLAIVGGILLLRVPGNPLSWMLYAVALGLGLVGLFGVFGDDTAEQVATGIFLFTLLIPVFGVMVPLLFPTGRPHSRRWKWVAPLTWSAVGVMWIALVVEMAITGEVTGDVDCSTAVGCVANVGLGVVLVCVVAAVVSFVVRWRRSRGLERTQLRWLVPPFLVLMIGLIGEFGGGQGGWVANIFLPLGLFLVPVAIAIAITRYRLYEIDRIISRTISYAIVLGLLVGAVALPAALVGTRFESPLVVAATTLAVAALFNPLRRRVQTWVDRRFNRSKYDVERVMDEFAGTLRDQTDAGEVVEGWVGTVRTTMHPSSVGVWVK